MCLETGEPPIAPAGRWSALTVGYETIRTTTWATPRVTPGNLQIWDVSHVAAIVASHLTLVRSSCPSLLAREGDIPCAPSRSSTNPQSTENPRALCCDLRTEHLSGDHSRRASCNQIASSNATDIRDATLIPLATEK